MTVQIPERFEWDFDSCPEEQLELCFEYERARSSADQQDIKDAESWRKQGIKWASDEDRKAWRRTRDYKCKGMSWFDQPKDATFDDYWKQIPEDNYPMSAVYLYPEFPIKSYLSITEPERKRRFALVKSAGVWPVAADDDKLSAKFKNTHGGEDRSWFEEGFEWVDRHFNLSKSQGRSHKGFPYEIEGNALKN